MVSLPVCFSKITPQQKQSWCTKAQEDGISYPRPPAYRWKVLAISFRAGPWCRWAGSWWSRPAGCHLGRERSTWRREPVEQSPEVETGFAEESIGCMSKTVVSSAKGRGSKLRENCQLQHTRTASSTVRFSEACVLFYDVTEHASASSKVCVRLD